MSDAKPEENKAEEKKEEAKGEAGAVPGGENSQNSEAKFKSVIDTTNKIERIVLNSEEEKYELEKIRRWRVQITEIYITSQEMFDCFLQFTVGGDFKINCYNIPSKNKKGKIVHGARGYSDYTELKEILQVDTRLKYEKEFNLEIRDSIINLMRQNLLVECWDYNSIKLNNYQGMALIDIMKIIRGSIYQSVMISKKIPEGNIMKPVCKIEFKIIFQEIWDFVLTFEDWSATNVNYLFGKDSSEGMYPGIEFTMKNSRVNVKNKVGQKDSANPEWGSFNMGFPFRGTLNDLDNEQLTMRIKEVSDSLINRENREFPADLRGITVNGLLKKYVPPDSINGKKLNDIPETLIAGKINVNNIPRFKQIGFESVINVEEIYICIYLQKLTFNQPPPFCKLPVFVFLTIEFNGKTCETIRLPIQNAEKKFNQHIYFLFGESNSILKKDKTERLNSIIKNLKLINEISVNLWIEDAYKCLDFIGKFNILLTDIFDKGKHEEKKYKKDDNSEISYRPKVFQGEDLFESAYLKQEVRLSYDVWFYPDDYTKNIEWPKEGLKRTTKENQITERVTEIIKQTSEEYEDLKNKLINQFTDYRKRFFDFIQEEKDGKKINPRQIFHLTDQNGNERIFNSYLSKLTIQEVKLESIFLEYDIDKIIKERAKIEKLILPIDNRKSLVHYIKCIRYIASSNEHIVLSPDYFMQTRKGTKYEHVIFLACLMMNLYSSKYPLKEDDEFQDEVEKLLEIELQNKDISMDKQKKKNEETKIEKDVKNVSGKGKEIELVGKNVNEDKESLGLIEKENDLSANMTEDLGRLDKTKDMTNRSVDQLLKKPSSMNENKKEKKELDPISSFIEQQKAKIEKELRKKPEWKKKKTESKFDTSDLVFICWGTLKGDSVSSNTNLHFWIMTFERNFKDVCFWEPLTNRKYVLRNRVMYSDLLKMYFKGKYNKEEEIMVELKKKRKKKNQNLDENKADKNKKKTNRMARMLNGDEDIDTQLIPQAPKDIMEEMDFMDVHVDIKKGLKYTQMSNNKDLAEEEYIRANNLIKKNKLTDEEDLKGAQSAGVQYFKWDEEYEDDELETKNDVLPYRTIDVIFNKKNIFVNKQNPNPVGIRFDLYDREKWYSVLKIREPGATDINASFIWKQDIPAFYSFKNFLPYYTDEEIESMKKSILSSITTKIKMTRSQKNFTSIFKYNRESREFLDLYLIFLEMKDLGLTNKADHKKRIEAWREYVITKNNKITMSLLPLFFNYSNETLISTYIDENCTDFITKTKKDSYFILSCKIFQYPNRVLSVRLLIAMCFKVGDDERTDENDPDIFQTEMNEPEKESDDNEDNEDKKLLPVDDKKKDNPLTKEK